MAKNNETSLSKKNQASAVQVVEELSTENAVKSMEETINIVRQEYGNYKITQKMREELKEELGVDAEVANGWEKVSDIFDHIDIYELVKRHPEAMGKVARWVASIVGMFFGPVGTVAHNIPDELAAKIVGFAGLLTPEHWMNVIAKAQVHKANEKRKQELLELEEQFKTTPDKKLLVVICKDELLLNEIRNLVETNDDTDGTIVGTADNSIKIIPWTEKTWKNNAADERLNHAKILFVGDIEGTETISPLVETKFEKFGVSYGWTENKAILTANQKVLEDRKNYAEFLKELKSLPLPESAKNTEKTGGKIKAISAVVGTLLLGPIGTAGALMGTHAKDKKNLIQQMLLYGIINLYNNDLEFFMNA